MGNQVDLFTDVFNSLSTNLIKWSNTLQQSVGKLPTNCFSVFDRFQGLALEGLRACHIFAIETFL